MNDKLDELIEEKVFSIVRSNMLTQNGYTPYCGSDVPRLLLGAGCDNPRTVFNGEQFVCPKCGWRSQFEQEFIEKYKNFNTTLNPETK